MIGPKGDIGITSVEPIRDGSLGDRAQESACPEIAFDVSRLMSMVNPDLRSPNEIDDCGVIIHDKSGTEITNEPPYKVNLCAVISKRSSTDSLGYFMLDHEVLNQLKIHSLAQSKDDGYIKLVTASLGKTNLCFFRELVPIDSSADIIGTTQPVKLTGFATDGIDINNDSSSLTYGIEPIKTKANPNEYKIRAQILSEPQRDFYLDEAIYSFSVEINNQGNKFQIPIVITDTVAKKSRINPETDIIPGKNINCNISLQGIF